MRARESIAVICSTFWSWCHSHSCCMFSTSPNTLSHTQRQAMAVKWNLICTSKITNSEINFRECYLFKAGGKKLISCELKFGCSVHEYFRKRSLSLPLHQFFSNLIKTTAFAFFSLAIPCAITANFRRRTKWHRWNWQPKIAHIFLVKTFFRFSAKSFCTLYCVKEKEWARHNVRFAMKAVKMRIESRSRWIQRRKSPREILLAWAEFGSSLASSETHRRL